MITAVEHDYRDDGAVCDLTGGKRPATGMTLDIDAIEARAAKATAGPWRTAQSIRSVQTAVLFANRAGGFDLRDCPSPEENAAFIAAARQDVPALIAEVRRLREAQEWRTMDSAPKDGTEIIAYRPDQGVFVCRWSTMEELVAHDMNGDPIEDYNEDQEDWWHDRWGWLERELAPTLWMPLPAGPVQS